MMQMHALRFRTLTQALRKRLSLMLLSALQSIWSFVLHSVPTRNRQMAEMQKHRQSHRVRPPPNQVQKGVVHAARFVRAVFFALLVLGQSCSEQTRKEKRFNLRGEVTLLIPSTKKIVVRHGPVDGWSVATNMEYPLGEGEDLEALAEGDQIEAVVMTEGSRYWLTDIEVIRTSDPAK